MTDNKLIMQQFAAWARSHGIKKPDTMDELHVLFDQFISERAQAAEAVHAVIGGGPVFDASSETHLVNDGATVQIADPAPQGIFESDWDRLLRDRTKASVGPNGEILDDFDTEFQMMGVNAAQQAAIAPPTNTNPASAANALLGGQAQADSTKDPIEVIRWVGEDQEATTLNIAAGPVKGAKNIPLVPANLTFRSFLLVQFGSRGYSFSAEIDIGNGVQFTVGGSFLSVAIGADTDQAGNTKSQTLSATASFGDTMRTAPLTRTRYSNAAGGGTPIAFTVPLFAKKFWVVLADPASTAIINEGSGQGTPLVQFTQVAASTAIPTEPYILIPDAQSVVVTPSTNTAVWVIYELEL